MDDKQLKLNFKKDAQQNPEKHYPVKALQELGFKRGQCITCKNFYWSIGKQSTCGDSACSGGFRFVNNSPAKKNLNNMGPWQRCPKSPRPFGYPPINVILSSHDGTRQQISPSQ